MADVVVYGASFSNFVRAVLMALEEKGIAYTNVRIPLHTPEHYAMNPFGKIPVMKHGDFVLAESVAICRYVDEAFEGPALRPGDVKTRALVDQWVGSLADSVSTAVIRNYLLAYLVPKWRGEPVDMDKVAAGVPAMQRNLAVVEQHLEGRDWLVGDGPTLADLFLAPIVAGLPGFPESRAVWDASPNLRRWFAGISARPSFTRTEPPKLG